MTRNTRTMLLVLVCFICGVVYFAKVRFILGAAFINIGYFFQDGTPFVEHEGQAPVKILDEIMQKNNLSSFIRQLFPRTNHHPVVALVACMDGRLHTEELVGDTRSYYYVVRTAGSVIEPPEIEMLELAVANGVKVILFTTHTDCAAEKVSKDEQKSKQFPNLSAAVHKRDQRFKEFLNRPLISQKIANGELLVQWLDVDTLAGGEFNPHDAS